MSLTRKITAIYDQIVNYLGYFSGVLLALITLSVTVDVIIRKLLNKPILGVVELCEHALVFITFLGASWVLRQEGHVRLDLVLGLLNPKFRAILNTVTSLIGAMLCMFIFYRGGLTVWDLWQRDIDTTKFLELPMAPLYTVICIGALMLSLQFLKKAHAHILEWKASR